MIVRFNVFVGLLLFIFFIVWNGFFFEFMILLVRLNVLKDCDEGIVLELFLRLF